MNEILMTVIAFIFIVFQIYLWRLFAEFIGSKLGIGRFVIKVFETIISYFKKEKVQR